MREFTFNHFLWMDVELHDYQLFTIALAIFSRQALLFNQLGVLGVLLLCNLGDILSPLIEYLWVCFEDSPTK